MLDLHASGYLLSVAEAGDGFVGVTMVHVYTFADSSHAAADSSFASRRELCFTLEGDIFVRYQSYQVSHTQYGYQS